MRSSIEKKKAVDQPIRMIPLAPSIAPRMRSPGGQDDIAIAYRDICRCREIQGMFEVREGAEELVNSRPDPDFGRVEREQPEGGDENRAAVEKNDEIAPRRTPVAAQDRKQQCQAGEMHDDRNADDERGESQLMGERHGLRRTAASIMGGLCPSLASRRGHTIRPQLPHWPAPTPPVALRHRRTPLRAGQSGGRRPSPPNNPDCGAIRVCRRASASRPDRASDSPD